MNSRAADVTYFRRRNFFKRLQLRFSRSTPRNQIIKGALLALNIILFVGTVFFVIQKSHSNAQAQAINLASKTTAASSPLDQLSSANIALTVARMGSLPEAVAINNQSDSQKAELNMAATANVVVTKPQVVTTALKSRADIVTYIAKPGDTPSTIAAHFGVTTDSILWSNGLSGNDVAAGQKLYIPPVNGIVYAVKSGDTPDSLAGKFNASKVKIIAYNDAELGGLHVGERIIIPNGSIAPPAAPAYSSYSAPVVSGGVAWGNSPVYGYNGYDFGECTWYVATQISVPANWGNAATWAYFAAQDGWNVSAAPTVGAIAQTPYAAGGYGHVAIVDGVSSDGSQVHIREMNHAGWDVVDSRWVSTPSFPNYITR